MHILTGLNDAQYRAVTAPFGAVLIVAGPGTGKTRVMIHRIAYLLTEKRIPARHILALTFTTKAAQEMRQRLLQLVGKERMQEVTIQTFHAFCLQILRVESDALAPFGLAEFSLLNSSEQLEHVKAAMLSLHIDEKDIAAKDVLYQIDRAKDAMIDPAVIAEQAQNNNDTLIARIYDQYQKRLRFCHQVDFADIIWLTEYLWRTMPTMLTFYQERWNTILVDEFQDVNIPQYRLVRLLGQRVKAQASASWSLCVVGDDDQCIYGWRGASSHVLTVFERDFRPVVIALELNYRNSQVIFEMSQHIIQQNTHRLSKHLMAVREAGELVMLGECKNEEDEANYVVQEVQLLLSQKKETRLSDIAVMYRTNTQARALEDACVLAGLSYHIDGGSFYERQEIQEVMGYLQTIYTPDSVNKAWMMGRTHLSETKLERLLTELQEALTLFSFPIWLHHVVTRTGYRLQLERDEQKEERLEALMSLERLANRWQGMSTERVLAHVIEYIVLLVKKTQEHGDNALHLLTLHSSKGKEFRSAFLIGLDDGTLPHSRSFGDIHLLEEERRLCYVGCTRAQDRLYLLWPRTRVALPSQRVTMPSRFLDSLPSSLHKHIRRG